MSAAEPAAKLPLWRTFTAAHRDLTRVDAAFVRFATLWLIILLALDAAINWVYWPIQQSTMGQFVASDRIYTFISTLWWIVVGAIVGIPLHRRILADRMAVIGASTLSTERRTLVKYVWRNFLIAAWTILPIVLIIYVSAMVIGPSLDAPSSDMPLPDPDAADISAESFWDGGSIAMRLAIILGICAALMPLIALMLYLPTRFSLSLPATAIESAGQTFAAAWSASSGSFWRLFWGGLLSYWPLLPVGVVIFTLTDFENQSRQAYVLSQSVGTAAAFFAGLVWVAFFSHAYRHLVRQSG